MAKTEDELLMERTDYMLNSALKQVQIFKYRAETAERNLAELQDAISPSRKGMVDNDYYLRVVQQMRKNELQINTRSGEHHA
jgi:hypothetical protein